MQKQIQKIIVESADLKKSLDRDFFGKVEKAAKLLIKSLKEGGKVLVAGNGGSAADAQHFAAELMGKFNKKRKALPAVSLATDTSFLTAWSNDFGFETVFNRQIEGLGQKGDVFFGISTSGNSKNIVEAMKAAKKKKMKTVLLLGNKGGRLKGKADIEIIVPSGETPRIQEVHILVIHVLCFLIEASTT